MTVEYGSNGTHSAHVDLPHRSVWRAMGRGLLGRCPHCGKGRIFNRFLKVADRCEACGEELHHHRADDFPPYATIFVVGHIVVPAMYIVEKTWRPDLWVHSIIWLPLTLALTLLLLPPIKGSIVGLQWALRMHGFHSDTEDEPVPQPVAAPPKVTTSPPR